MYDGHRCVTPDYLYLKRDPVEGSRGSLAENNAKRELARICVLVNPDVCCRRTEVHAARIPRRNAPDQVGVMLNACLGRCDGLDQTEGQFRESLDAIVSFVEKSKTSLRSALQVDAQGEDRLVITDEMVQRFSEQQDISLEEARSELEAQNK